MATKKHICLLGATGSIGDSSLDVLRRHAGQFHLRSVAAGKQWEKVLPLIAEFDLQKICIFEEAAAQQLRSRVSIPVLSGMDGLLELVSDNQVDYIINGLMGAIGCEPTLQAISSGKHIGLANKETMVMAGTLIKEALQKNPQSLIIPIDSEHSAIFQCLAGRPTAEIENLQLTASGGPFRTKPLEEFATIRKADALKHPTWVMGQKITIDSATLMNKGLEVIEAHFLFDIPMTNIKVIVHPTSIIHSMVQFRDGSLMAQLGCPDMRLPIQYAMTYPERWPLPVDRLDLTQIAKLEFFPPDLIKFPCLALAYEAGHLGGNAPAIINAANEIAVALFLAEKITFNAIPQISTEVLKRSKYIAQPNLQNILDSDAEARQLAKQLAE